jgi:hypothetical protein
MKKNIFRFHAGKNYPPYANFQDFELMGDLIHLDLNPGDLITIISKGPNRSEKHYHAEYLRKELVETEEPTTSYIIYHFTFSVVRIDKCESGTITSVIEHAGREDFPEAIEILKKHITNKGW